MINSSIFGNKLNSIAGVLLIYHSVNANANDWAIPRPSH